VSRLEIRMVIVSLIGISCIAVVVLAIYYSTNRWLRRGPAALGSRRIDIGVSTGILALAMPIGVASLLGFIISDLLSHSRVVSALEDALYVGACLAAVVIATVGLGMHAAGRSIDVYVDSTMPPTLRRTVALYHGPLSHRLIHIGWSAATAGLALLAAAHPAPEPDYPAEIVVVAGAIQGFVRAASVLEGQVWRPVLPFELLLSFGVGFRLAALGTPPVALFFLASLIAGVTLLMVWGIRHGGFPPTSAPRIPPKSA
jgi:hypothetical protein